MSHTENYNDCCDKAMDSDDRLKCEATRSELSQSEVDDAYVGTTDCDVIEHVMSADIIKCIEECNSHSIELQMNGVHEIAQLIATQQISREAIFHAQATAQLLNIASNTTDIDTKKDLIFILRELLDLDEFYVNMLVDQGVIAILLHLLNNSHKSNELQRDIILALSHNSPTFIDCLIKQQPAGALLNFLHRCFKIKDLFKDEILKYISITITNVISWTNFNEEMHFRQTQECFKMMRVIRTLLDSTTDEDIILPICRSYGNVSSRMFNYHSVIMDLIETEQNQHMQLCHGLSIQMEQLLHVMVPIEITHLCFQYLHIIDTTIEVWMSILYKTQSSSIRYHLTFAIMQVIVLGNEANIASLVSHHNIFNVLKYTLDETLSLIITDANSYAPHDLIAEQNECVVMVLHSISNIISYDDEQTIQYIQKIIDEEILQTIINLLLDGNVFALTLGIEALYCIRNYIFGGTLSQILHIIESGVFHGLVAFYNRFSSNTEGIELISNILDFVMSKKIVDIHAYLESSGAVKMVKSMMSQHVMYQTLSKELYEQCCSILDIRSKYKPVQFAVYGTFCCQRLLS